MSNQKKILPQTTMSPDKKTNSIILGYCLVLWITNWSLRWENSPKSNPTEWSIEMNALGAILGFIGSVVFARRIWRLIRVFLDKQVRIPLSFPLWTNWQSLGLLIPLFFGMTYHFSGTPVEGEASKMIFTYGDSWASPLCSGIAIMLFQLLIRLEAYLQKSQLT